MRNFIAITFIFFSFLSGAQMFSEDKIVFRQEAINKLRSIGTEPARKIAFDFKNAWDGKFTSAQQDKAHKIALVMQKKGYKFYPYFYHYFSYLAYSVEQQNLQRDELNKVLEINEQAILSLTKSEYKEFLFGLNIFFARRYLSYDKNLYVQAPEGSYAFEIIDGAMDIDTLESEEISEEIVSLENSTYPEQKESPIDNDVADNWSTDNDWDDTDWDSDDDWSDSDWDNSDWNSGNDWDSNDTWAEETETNDWDSPPVEEILESRPDYTANIKNPLRQLQFKFNPPKVEGPSIKLLNTIILMATPYDSAKINSVNGSFLLKDRTLVAKQGSIEWPARHKNFKGATVQLKEFYIKKDRPDFWTPNATLSLPSMFSEDIKGVFEFKSKRLKKGETSKYPIFTSDSVGYNIRFSEKASYTGGIELRGNELYGKSASEDFGTLKILDGRGNTIFLESKFFSFIDSVATMSVGKVFIIHGNDTISHTSVRGKYDFVENSLTIIRNASITPFNSTYFGVQMQVDRILWHLDQDSLFMDIMNAKGYLPASFESNEFYERKTFDKLGGYLGYNPIAVFVNYARKYGISEFYAGEIGLEHNISEGLAKAGGKLLGQYNFAEYDSYSGLTKLKKSIFHYYDATGEKIDYDNLVIPSKVKNGYNAVASLEEGRLKVKGVYRTYLTTNFKVYIQPFDSIVTILENKQLEFDGVVHAGDFNYQGIDHQFDYENFSVLMSEIDSIQLVVPILDTASVDSTYERTTLTNQIIGTEGTLFIDRADNKSGVKDNRNYPYFITSGNATFFFDGKEILNGAYDKSMRFIIPPFEVDSIDRETSESLSFTGEFNSGGIFPTFEETLHVQQDGSMGFVHTIPEGGYHLYGTEAVTYNEIKLSNQGLRGFGEIDFSLNTQIHSKDFIYYPDSVTSLVDGGYILPGNVDGTSYPEAVLSQSKLKWLPRKDSMYLKTIDKPFEFYNSTAKLNGEVNITHKGVFGSGSMLTRGSKSSSREITFEEYSYSAQHAKFEVLSDDATKPAMSGNDIRLDFDLNQNTATIQPEIKGVAAISFPYAQMKTSITEAVWDLEDSIVVMSKPDHIPLRDSYFYTTKEELDSIVFSGTKATYNINSQELKIEGIPYIQIADAKIIPQNQETTIFANSELRRFENAEIVMDTTNEYHYLDRASIKVISRNKFEGYAWYKQIVGTDTFDIRFDSFELQEVEITNTNKKGKKSIVSTPMTVSGGEVPKEMELLISHGFQYRGSVLMYSAKPALELEGAVKLLLRDPSYDKWINFTRGTEDVEVNIEFDNAVFDDGTHVEAGIFYDIRGELYTIFANEKQNATDFLFFKPSGALSHIENYTFEIQTPSKKDGKSYAGSYLIIEDSTETILFDGNANFIDPENKQLVVKSSVIGSGNQNSNEFKLNALLSIAFGGGIGNVLNNALFEKMGEELGEVIERIGPPTVNDLDEETLFKIANISSDETAKTFETKSLSQYTSLASFQEMTAPLMITSVDLEWSHENKSWYSTSRIGLSHINQNDINAELDGFLEIKKDDTGEDLLNLFIQPAPGVWYYYGYSQNQIVTFSSNDNFNKIVASKSNLEKARPEELVLVEGSTNETLTFINEFRLNYFGISEPFNLISPDQINLEDEEFNTIEEDDDGFGF